MENLIRQKIQELEQLRHNLLQNISSGDEPAHAYQQMSLEVVESCQAGLQQVLEALKGSILTHAWFCAKHKPRGQYMLTRRVL